MKTILRLDREVIKPYLTLIVVAVALYGFLLFVWPLMLPFFLALALAVLIDGPVRRLEARRIPRPLAILVTLTVLLASLALLLLYGLAALSVELAQLSRALPELWEGLLDTTRRLQQLLTALFENAPADVYAFLEQQRTALLEILLSWVAHLLDVVRRWAFQGIPNAFVMLMITGLATYLMSRDKEGILAFLPKMVPARWRPQAINVAQTFVGSAIGFVNALVTLISITTVVTVVALSLLGSSYAVLIGVVTGVLDLVPVLGPGLIFLPWALYHLILGEPLQGVVLAAIYGILTVLRTVLEPRIIGTRVGLHPLSTLIALYVGLRLFGMSGFVIGPMVAILLRSLARTGLFGLDTDGPPEGEIAGPNPDGCP